MFTGIVEALGKIEQLSPQNGGMRVSLATPFKDLTLGESVCTSGVCLTVEEARPTGRTQFFLSDETLERTRFKHLRLSEYLNLERAVTPSTRFSGHYVQGHVDGVGKIIEINTLKSESRAITMELPQSLMKYCVEKGSITIDGISLTINKLLAPDKIELMMIPHTWKITNFQYYTLGTETNVEVDILAKYVENLCQPCLKQ